MAETTEPKKKVGAIKDYLDNTFTKDGLRTDIRITLTNETSIKIIAVAVIATGLSTLTFYMIKSMFTPKAIPVR